MAAMPPLGESNYPRDRPYGSGDKLQALADGYFGLTRVFLINLVVLIAVVVAAQTGHLALWLSLLVVLFILSGVLSYPPNKKVGEGLGWGSNGALLASVGIALLSWFCFGAIGYGIVQSMAIKEMKKYGLKVGGFRGLKKPAVRAMVAELRSAEANYGPAANIQPPPS